MRVSVVDCTAIAAVAFAEPDGEAVVGELAESRLIAPVLLPFELAQVCATKCRLHPAMSATIADQYSTALSRLSIEFAPVDFDAIPGLA